ncbi:MAG TPA: acetyl-CoA C-acetyltransferase [Phaeodactylibacter sp.]|nr:acetyl-CoA C-acetyltransferase [Phaeodactylibacter sp.]
MTEAYIFDTIRTPRGKGKKTGSLYEVRPIELLTTLLSALKERNSLDTSQVDDCLIGVNAPLQEQGGNIARAAVLHAGYDLDVPAAQVNRFCSSGLEAVNLAAAKVRSGWEDLVIAGGVESMSRIPLGSDGGAMFLDPVVSRNIGFIPQGVSADLIATLAGFSRTDVDEVAVLSQQRAAHAQSEGWFAPSIIPVKDQNELVLLDKDEFIRPDTTLEILAQLNPAFQKMGEAGYDRVALQKYFQLEKINHVHHAGNSSGIVDGAALVLVGSEEKGKALNLKPRARIVSTALVGLDPTIMLTGPAPASQKALKKAGMNISDIDLIEVNEAFAGVVLQFMREMKLNDFDKINVNGGAIAMGHPIGATGAILLGTCLDELERRDLNTGLVTLCIGGGMGIATVIERSTN